MKRYFAFSAAMLILIAALGGGVQTAQRSRYVAYGADSVAQAFAPASEKPLLPDWMKTTAGLTPPPFGNLYWLARALAEKLRDMREDVDLEFPEVIRFGCGIEQARALEHGGFRRVEQQEVAVNAGRLLEPAAFCLVIIG